MGSFQKKNFFFPPPPLLHTRHTLKRADLQSSVTFFRFLQSSNFRPMFSCFTSLHLRIVFCHSSRLSHLVSLPLLRDKSVLTPVCRLKGSCPSLTVVDILADNLTRSAENTSKREERLLLS